MITKINILKNIGQFESFAGVNSHKLEKLTLIYAENGCGKTTLAAILRSFATNDPMPIVERKRLGSSEDPHIILSCEGSFSSAIFKDNAWTNHLNNVVVFDDLFVDQNVYSGLSVGSSQRQKLHELILGAEGVALNKQVQEYVSDIENQIKSIRAKSAAIPDKVRENYSINDFCALAIIPDIDDKIKVVEQSLAAAQSAEKIASNPAFDILSLPSFNLFEVESVLQKGLSSLSTNATSLVESHFSKLGVGAEEWVGDGIDRFGILDDPPLSDSCPFCDQSLESSNIIAHYKEYFSDEYSALKKSIDEQVQGISNIHDAAVHTSFERSVRILGERLQFWKRYCDIPEIVIDTEAIIDAWRNALTEVGTALLDKQDKPLETFALPARAKQEVDAYEAYRQSIASINANLKDANELIMQVKDDAADADIPALKKELALLKATKTRHEPTTAVACNDYLYALESKKEVEEKRDRARDALDTHRVTVFPNYESRINYYLELFNVGFRLRSVQSTNTRGGSTCSYEIIINNFPVAVAGGNSTPGAPGFHNTLSAGDRNTLALAFFCTTLDLDSTLSDKIVVVDDPMTSLDEHRSLTTIQQMRTLAANVKQVIVLSHSKTFLCGVWHYAERSACATLRVISSSSGSVIDTWTIKDEAVTEYDRHHLLLREYAKSGLGDERNVAGTIRLTLEGFLRRACTEHFAPGEVLGNLRHRIRESTETILSPSKVQELDRICDYANKFHHDTNEAYMTEAINRSELSGWVKRTLDFVKV